MPALSNFTVPPTNGSAGSLLMPKLKYRFRATFNNFGVASNTELTKQVVNIKRPSVKFEPVTIDVYNSKVYLQGKPAWEETTINIRDDITGAVNKQIGQQIQKQFDFMEQASAPAGTDYKFQLIFDMLDGGNGATAPTVLESWQLDGCFLTGVDYGEMSYKENDPVEIVLTIRFDNAIQTVGGAVGTTVPFGTGTTITG
jgi:hypothetical protein